MYKKISLLIITILIFSKFSSAQDNQTVIQLKSGYSVEGQIISSDSSTIKLKLKDDRIYEIKKSDVLSQISSSESESKKLLLTIGFEIAINSSTIVFDQINRNTIPRVDEKRKSVNIGIPVLLPISKSLSVRSGLYFENKGCIKEKSSSSSNYYYSNDPDYFLNYISIPLNIQVEHGKKLKGFINTGLTPSILISQENVASATSWDVNLNIGCGGTYQITENFDLTTRINYSKGIINTESAGGENFSEKFLKDGNKNKLFGVLFGVLYHL